MTNKIFRYGFLVIFVALFFISCDDKQVFDEYKTISDGWSNKNTITFAFEKDASSKPYNMFINVRNNNDFEFSNLFLIAKLEHPNGLIKVDTLEYQMANPDGTLLGEGFSDLKESKLWYKKNYVFNQKGKYKISIKQSVRQSGKIKGVQNLQGIKEIGFRIESIQTK
jgi:gliding motility-associated lipoprotein GldH